VRKGTVRLQHDVARRIRAGHPWVYREALGQRAFRTAPGEAIELVDLDGEFVGHGVFDGESAIAVRVFSRNPARVASNELVADRVAAAIDVRRRLFDFDSHTCLRLINGEADGAPAMFVDRYGDYLVAQLFTPAVERFRGALYDQLERSIGPAAIYEQKRFRPLSGDAPKGGAELVRGTAAPVELEVSEGDLKFWVDVTSPLSTGLFSDLREGRRAIARWARGRRVLNLFSYTGSISVYAQHGGATDRGRGRR
jgi:23S rRNA (cytosine1962-C5)-methyltransferase